MLAVFCSKSCDGMLPKREPEGAKREPKGSQREPKRMYHLSPLAMRCLGGPKTAPREPRGSQRVPKGAKREPKGSQREPKGRPKGAQGEAKSIKTQGFFWHGFREATKWVAY